MTRQEKLLSGFTTLLFSIDIFPNLPRADSNHSSYSRFFIFLYTAIIGSIKLSHTIFTSTIFGQLSLASTQQASEGYIAADIKYESMIGKTGIAHTNLRPAGKVNIEDDIFDATALTGFIDRGNKVKVVKYETSQLFVLKDE